MKNTFFLIHPAAWAASPLVVWQPHDDNDSSGKDSSASDITAFDKKKKRNTCVKFYQNAKVMSVCFQQSSSSC